MKNQGGVISVDFLISLSMASVFCVILFAFTMTFTVVEVAQYIAFSSSRAFIAGHVNMEHQKNMGNNKFAQFLGGSGSKVFLPLFKNGWFELSPPDIRGGGDSGQNFNSEYGPPPPFGALTGLRMQFKAKLLSLNFSLLGSTSTDPDGFVANVTGLLIREPTTEECQRQLRFDNRFRAILNLDPSRYSISNTPSDKYVPMEDNGC